MTEVVVVASLSSNTRQAVTKIHFAFSPKLTTIMKLYTEEKDFEIYGI